MPKFLEMFPVMPVATKREEAIISLKKVEGDLQANQMGWKRALSRGDRRTASNIQDMIGNLEAKRARILGSINQSETKET